jgi:hypothetical protein
VWWYLTFTDPQYTVCCMPPIWQLDFWESFQIFQKTVLPSTEHSSTCLACHKLTNSAATELWLLTRYWDTAGELHCFNKTCWNAVWGSDRTLCRSAIRGERDCKHKNPLCTVTEVLSLCHKGTNASVSWAITLKIKICFSEINKQHLTWDGFSVFVTQETFTEHLSQYSHGSK